MVRVKTSPAAVERRPKTMSSFLLPMRSAKYPAIRLKSVEVAKPPDSTSPVCHRGKPSELRYMTKKMLTKLPANACMGRTASRILPFLFTQSSICMIGA